MKQLGENNRERAIDLLCERLAFERAGVQLYDRVIQALEASGGSGEVRGTIDVLQRNRTQEAEHAIWLETQIRALGGDATLETDLSRLATRESRGITEVVENDTADLTHLLHALLAAEAVDAAGWDLLMHLAQDAGDSAAHREFRRRNNEEQGHLATVRDAIEHMALRSLLGTHGVEERALDIAASIPP
jgi:hypothetical protein